jgi:hypothetical protein
VSRTLRSSSRLAGGTAIAFGLVLAVSAWFLRPGSRPTVRAQASPSQPAGTTVPSTTTERATVVLPATTRPQPPATVRPIPTTAPTTPAPPAPPPAPPRPPQVVVVGPAANGTTVTLRLGDTLVIRLGNCGCGKSWALYAYPSAVVLTYDGERTDPTAANGQLFTFSTKAAHRTSLSIGYYGPKDAAPEQTVGMTVAVTT